MKTSDTPWPVLPIKSTYKGLYDGPHATPRPATSGPIFLGIKNVTEDGRLDLGNVRHIAEDDFVDWTRRVEPRENDLVFTYEATLNRYALIPKGFRGCLGRRMALIRPNPEIVDVKYLFYYFFTDEWRSVIRENMLSGATVDRIPLTSFPDFPIRVPPLPIQRHIAGILSAYDDLIENNQRRIKILEEMARRLYREWFVHFRFPGHEDCRLVESPLGEIPEGWEVKLIADLCESVNYGYTASASTSEVGPKLLRITDIVPDLINWEDVPYCEISEAKAPKYLLNPGDIVVARTGATTGYAKRLNKLHPSTVFASYLVRLRAGLGVSNRMLGILMESDVYKRFIEMNLGGAAQPQANAVVLTSMRLAIPPAPLADEFDRLVEPIFDEAELLSVNIQNLRRTRDLLLPRLLSGQIDVDSLPEPVLSEP